MHPVANRLVIGTTIKEQITTSFFAHLPALVQAGWQVHVVASPGPWPSGPPPVPVESHEISMAKEISPAADVRALAAWIQLLREVKPAVVIGGSPKAALLAMTAARAVGVPRRIHLHRGARWETLDGARRSLTKAADRATAAAATEVVAVSASLAQLLQESGVTRRRATVLAAGGSKGVDLQRFHPPPIPTCVGPVTLGFIGRLAADKGLTALVAGLDAVRQSYPDARLVVIGEIDTADPPPASVIARLADDPAVSMLGWRTDVPELLRDLDVLVFPSAREGLPNAVIEAAASGVPAVGWGVTGVRDAIADGYSGVLVPPGDIDAFARSTRELVEFVRAPGSPWPEQARQWAQRFDTRRVTDAWLTLLDGGEPVERAEPTRASLAVVIVTFNSADTIVDCVDALARFAPGCHLVVIDNGAQATGIRATIAARLDADESFATWVVMDAPENLGYARGVNTAVELVPDDAEYLLILNPDVTVSADPLDLVPGLERADVTAGRLLGELPNVSRETTYVSELLRAVAGVRFRYSEVAPGTGDAYVPQLAGAYLLQRMDYYRAHPLDESFDLYYEDVDYCDRARAGRGVLLQDRVVGSHIGGASSGRVGEVAYVAGRVSRLRYLRRRYPRAPRPALLAPFALELAMRSATGQPEGADARRRAWWAVRAELRRPGSVNPLLGRGERS